MNASSPEGARTYSAIVLAADRAPGDPVAAAARVPGKCMAPVAGEPMVMRVLAALGDCPAVADITLVGPPAHILPACPPLEALVNGGRVDWRAPLGSPSASAADALSALEAGRSVLLTTADHALLDRAVIDAFLAGASRSGADVAVGLAPIDVVRAGFPGVRRTTLEFAEGGFSTCNLFALLTARGRAVVDVWRKVEHERKRPLRMLAGILGMPGALRYLLGMLSLEAAAARIESGLGIRVAPVLLQSAHAAVDVDTPEDLRLAEAYLQRRGQGDAAVSDSG